MALRQRKSNLSANAEVNARAALLAGGWMDIYDGTQPATPEEAPGVTAHRLASVRFGDPAFEAGVEGLAIATPMTSDPDAATSGDATWYRLTQSDHTTAVEDGSVGVFDANLVLASVSIPQHAEVVIDGFILGVAKS